MTPPRGNAGDVMAKKFFFAAPPLRILLFALLVAVALVLRLLPLGAALASPEFPDNISRPDTPGYLSPARSLAFSGTYEGTGRAPGFPFFLSLCFRATRSGDCRLPAVLLTIAGILTAALCGAAARIHSGDRRTGFLAALLAALNLTAIANAPMLLSDTLFGLFAALQWLVFVIALRRKEVLWLPLAAGIAAVGALIRPINVAWIAPLAVLILFFPECGGKKRLAAAALAALFFFAPILPWMCRNHALGAGYTIDTNTGAMLHQNGAMLRAAVNGTGFEAEKAKLLAEQQEEFLDTAAYPDEASREAWRMRRLLGMIAEHPFRWIRQHFDWHILLPDVPTLSELFGATTPGRGTMGVLASDGVLAAVRHYFNDRMWILWVVLPLLLPTALLYFGAAAAAAGYLWRLRDHWFDVLVLLAFAEYYFFLPGAITAPRYQIPALPCLSALAAAALVKLIGGGHGETAAKPGKGNRAKRASTAAK